MNDLQEQGQDKADFPRLHHWLLAAAGLFALTMTVPVIAGFI